MGQWTTQLTVQAFFRSNRHLVGFQDLVKYCILAQTKQPVQWRTQSQIYILSLVSTKQSVKVLDLIQGPDQHDSNCIDFRNIGKIRYIDRIVDHKLEAPGILNGLRVGVLDEFNVEELDERNRKI